MVSCKAVAILAQAFGSRGEVVKIEALAQKENHPLCPKWVVFVILRLSLVLILEYCWPLSGSVHTSTAGPSVGACLSRILAGAPSFDLLGLTPACRVSS